MKYRIVRRNRAISGDYFPDSYWYYAQVNVFGIWIDCHWNPFISDWGSYDTTSESVEQWIQGRKIKTKQEVVKTYD